MSDQALGNELAARHFLAHGRITIARGYLIEAARLYDRWGAKEARRRLVRTHPDLLSDEGWELPSSVAPASVAASSLDVASALKASQAIAGEIVLPRLLEQLLRIIVENAGARRGILILKREGSLLAFAEHSTGEEPQLDAVPLETRTDLAVSVAHYVARTEEDVLLDENAADGPFGADPTSRGGRRSRRWSRPWCTRAGSPACSTSRTTSPRAPSRPIGWSSFTCWRRRSRRRSRTPSSTPSSSARSRSAPRSCAAPTRRSSRCTTRSRRARTRRWRRSAR